MNDQRRLLVVSGPSGVGKDSVVRTMVAKHPGIEISVSCTTRPRKEGEREGVDYHYISREEFEEGIKADAFWEYADYNGNYYGTLKSEVDRRIYNGITCVLVIEVKGAAKIKQTYPDCTSVFILPPSREVLECRIRQRGRETDEYELSCRIRLAEEEEMPLAHTYDYRITNNDLESCAEELYDILKTRQQG